jgi:hypothetical protein
VNSKEHLTSGEHLQLKGRARTSVWVWLAAVAGWLLAQIPTKKRKTYPVGNDQDGNRPSGEIKLVPKSERPKSGGGLWSLVLELLMAIGLRLGQRYVKSWSSSVMVQLKTPTEPKTSVTALPGKISPQNLNFSDHQSELSQTQPYRKGIVALFKNTASEWIQDKCPQLGAALAYFTVFSLAPLVLVLLAVFGLIFGSSDQARQKLTEQLQYLIDPSGIKVIQDIAANAAKPQAGIVATAIGVILALFGASGVFGQLQDALNTIWGVKPKPGGGIMVLYARDFSRLRWSAVFASSCWSL